MLFRSVKLFMVLISHAGVSPTAVAVQSPYVAQVQLLRDMLDEFPEAAGIEVATIDSFQGLEADAVIISMVLLNIHTYIYIHIYCMNYYVFLLKYPIRSLCLPRCNFYAFYISYTFLLISLEFAS